MEIFAKRLFGLLTLSVLCFSVLCDCPVSASINDGFFAPAISIEGLKFYTNDPFKLSFFINEDGVKHNDDQVKEEVQKLIDYFLVALTIPEDELGVSFPFHEKYRIINPELGSTKMGQEMLSQDYILSQLVEDNNELEYGFAATNLQKVWIVPDKAVVYVDRDKVYVGEATLKVMMGKNTLPVITKEVNEGVKFSSLRQIYKSVILAAWFKKNLKENLINKLYADKKKINSLVVVDPIVREKLYDQNPGLSGIIRRQRFSVGLRLDPDPKTFPLNRVSLGTVKAYSVVDGKILESGVLRRVIYNIPAKIQQAVKDGVKELEIYDDRIADAFLAMVWSFRDAGGRPILLFYKEKLDRARSDCGGDYTRLAKAEEGVIKELVPKLQGELLGTNENGFSFLPQIIRSRRSNCVGRIQIFYILGNYLELRPQGIEVLQYWDNHFMPEGTGHVETIFTLSDGKTMMTNTINGTASDPFDFEATFVQDGNYWGLRNNSNPLLLHRRIRPLLNGVLAPVYSNLGSAYRIQGNLSRAIDAFTKAVAIDPGYVPAYYNRGFVYSKTGDVALAKKDFKRVEQLNLQIRSAFAVSGKDAKIKAMVETPESKLIGMSGDDDPVDGFTFKITSVTCLERTK